MSSGHWLGGCCSCTPILQEKLAAAEADLARVQPLVALGEAYFVWKARMDLPSFGDRVQACIELDAAYEACRRARTEGK